MAMTPEQKLTAVAEILWPPGDPSREWDTRHVLERISNVIGEGSRSENAAGRAVAKIHGTLYAEDWTADTLQDVAWVVEGYNNGRSQPRNNPTPGPGLGRRLVAAGLAAVGVTGLVLGIREQRR